MNCPSHCGSMRSMRSSIGGWVAKALHKRCLTWPKNRCDISSARAVSTKVPALWPPMILSASPIPSGFRVNCTAEASARYSFCLEMADLISPAIRPPNRPIRYSPRPMASTAPRPSSFLLLRYRRRCDALRSKMLPTSPIKVMPLSIAARRMLSRMSPFRMWLNSCPMTP